MTSSIRTPVLGVSIDSLHREGMLEKITSLMFSGRPHQLVTVNSLTVLEVQNNPPLKSACENASLVVPESSGLSWAARVLNRTRVERFAGIDLSFELCGVAARRSLPVYLLGGAPGVADKAAGFLSRVYPNLQISGVRDGFFKPEDEPAIIRDIARSHARLVLVALGMPKQEIWIHRNLPNFPPAVYIGVGGTLDIWAGRLLRAPLWVRRTGMEWFYRFLQEPRRWRRIARLPKFALKVASEKFN